MKRGPLHHAAESLIRREQALQGRFLTNIMAISYWDSDSADRAAAYISLLHSEAEHTLEELIRRLLDHGRIRTDRHSVDPALINVCVYFADQFGRHLANGVLPKRAAMENDRTAALKVWDELGARAFHLKLLDKNHGAGMPYVEKLFHPLGICVNERPFRQFLGCGVKQIHDLADVPNSMLAEFTSFRGSAVHAGSKDFRTTIQHRTPGEIAQSGERVTNFVSQIAESLHRNLWGR